MKGRHPGKAREEQAALSVPHGRRDRLLDVAEAALWLGLLVVGSLVALEVLREDAGRARSAPARKLAAPSGLVDAEELRVVAMSREFNFWLQPTSGFTEGRWSKDGHMFGYGTRKGDWIDFELPAVEAGSYRLELFLTKSADYGIVAVSLNGARVGPEIDLWSYGVVPTGPLDLGAVQLGGSKNVLRLQVTGTNPEASAPFFQFGFDGLRLTKQP